MFTNESFKKNNRRRKNENLEKRIKELEDWKNSKNIINSKIIEKVEEINFIIERLKNNEEKKNLF